jgi:hypothetical protein
MPAKDHKQPVVNAFHSPPPNVYTQLCSSGSIVSRANSVTNGLRYLRVGGVGEGREQEKPEARKMHKNAAESNTSDARFVGRRVMQVSPLLSQETCLCL